MPSKRPIIEDEDSSAASSMEESFKDQHGTSWLDVTWLLLSDVVGTSVLTFAGVARSLGWVLTVVFILGLFPLAVFTSFRMSTTRTILCDCAKIQGRKEPALGSMGEVAGQVFRSNTARLTTYIFVYGYNFLGQASYLLVLGTSLQQLANQTKLCIYTAVLIGCVIVLPGVIFVRRLRESVKLCFFNLFLIVAVIAITLGSIAHEGRSPCATSPAFAPDLTFMTAFGAATNVVYSYCGQWMYFEIMDTMKTPSDFPKAFQVAGPFMVTSYLVVALVSYYYAIEAGDIVDAMPRGQLLSFVASLLFAHVGIVYLIKSIVLQMFFHAQCSPQDLHKRNWASYSKHGGFGFAILVFGYLIANAVPFFSQLLGLIGGFLGGPINFMLPLYMFVAARGRHLKLSEKQEDDDKEDEDYSGDDELGPRWDETSGRAFCRGLKTIAWYELALMAFIMVFFLMVTVVGVTDQIKQIISLNGDFGAPFTCHELPAPHTATDCNVSGAIDLHESQRSMMLARRTALLAELARIDA